VLDKPRKAEREAIEPPFERSLDLLPRIATGRMNDAMTWLHTQPKPEGDDARPKAAAPREAKEP
jgi:hypothetical protein